MSTASNSRYYSLTSSSQRKEVLWNVQQPGDPYDIKKSMIAKLPGGGTFMGDHLEIICLLQAAEIQRLTDFLEIYKFKFKDLQRMELDRHSYEIQIKELSQKIEEMDSLKGENSKLKEFIKKQGIQLEEIKQSLRTKSSNQQWKIRYEQIFQHNEELKTENRILKSELSGLQTKLNAFETAKTIQIEEFKRKLSQKMIQEPSYQKQDTELAFRNYKVTIEGELKKLEIQIRRLQELNQLKSRDINVIRSDNQLMKEDIDRLTLQRDSLLSQTKFTQDVDDSEYSRLKHDYESKIAILSSELEHKTNMIRQKQFRFSEIHHKNTQFEQMFLQTEIRIKDLEGKLKNRDEEIVKLNQLIMKIDREGARASGQSQEQQIQYESKIRQLSQEIETLNSRLVMEVNHEKQAKELTERKSFENTSKLQLLIKENEDLKKSLLESTDLKRQLADLQSQRALLIQEVERLNELNNTKNSQLSRLKILSTENQNLKSRISQIQRQWSSRYDAEILRIKTEYEYKFTEISQMKGNELQSRAVLFEQELDKTRNLLKEKNNEAEKYKALSFEWQSKFNNFELDQTRQFRNYQTTLSTLKRENEQLYTKIRLQHDLELQVKEFKNKTLLMEGEFQQITTLLRSRQDQNGKLKNKIDQDQSEFERKYFESNKKISQLTQKIVEVSNENEQLRKKISELINNSNNISKETITEINRLTSTLRTAEEEKGKSEMKIRQLTQEIQYQKQNLTGFTQDIEQLRRKLLQAENRNQSLLSENSSSRNNLQIENDSLRRQINQFKVSITNYEAQITRRIKNYESNIQALTLENQEIRKRFRQIELKNSQTDQQYKIKVEECFSVENKIRNLSLENENLKKYIKDYQLQVTNKFDGEVSRKYQNYEQTIQKVSRQYDELKRINTQLQYRYEEFRRKNNDLERNYEDIKKKYTDNQNVMEDLRRRLTESEHRYSILNSEYDKLNYSLKSVTEDIQAIKRQKTKKQGMFSSYESDINKKITQYENSMFNMTKSKEQLQRKINQNDLALKLKYQQFNRLEVNYRTITQELEISKRRYTDLENLFNQKMEGEVISKYKLYDRAIEDLSKEGDQLRRKLAETSNQLNKKNMEINNLNPVLGENENLKKRIEKYETSIAAYEAEVNRQFVSYELKVENLAKDNQLLKRKLMEGTEITKKLSLETQDKVLYLTRDLERINSNSQLLQKQNGELRKRVIQLGDLSRIVAELENRLAITNQELERTNANLRSKCDDFNKLQNQHRNLQVDLEATRKKQNQYESRVSYTLQNQIPKKYNSYEQTIMELKRKISEFENKNQTLNMDIQRFNITLRGKENQLAQLINNFNNLSNEFEQFKRRAKETETINNQNIQNVRQENDELRRKLQQYDVNLRQFGHDSDRKIVEYENKTKIMIQEIERLNQTVTTKNEELERHIRKIKEYEITLNQRAQLEMRNKVNSENTLNALRRENDELKRKLQQYGEINQIVIDYSNKLNLIGQQYEKTSYILKQKTEEYSKLEIAYRNLSRQNEEQKRKIQQLTDFNKRIIEYQQKINIIIQQNEKLQYSLRVKTDELNNSEARLRQLTADLEQSKRHVLELEQSLKNKYQTEISRKTNSYEQNIMILSREREDLQRKRIDYENKITNLSSEIERLNGLVKTRTQELQRSIMETQSFRKNSQRKLITNQNERTALQTNYNNLLVQLEVNKKNLFEYEGKIRQLNGQFQRLKAIIEQLEKSRQELYAKNLILSQEIERLTYQNKDLEIQTKDVRLRLSDESSLQKRINEHLSLMVILFAEIQTLRNRVTAKEKEVETVRRSSLSPHMLKH